MRWGKPLKSYQVAVDVHQATLRISVMVGLKEQHKTWKRCAFSTESPERGNTASKGERDHIGRANNATHHEDSSSGCPRVAACCRLACRLVVKGLLTGIDGAGVQSIHKGRIHISKEVPHLVQRWMNGQSDTQAEEDRHHTFYNMQFIWKNEKPQHITIFKAWKRLN